MPVAGLEPALCCHKQILSLPRLPFRHTGLLLSQPKYMLPYSPVFDKQFFPVTMLHCYTLFPLYRTHLTITPYSSKWNFS